MLLKSLTALLLAAATFHARAAAPAAPIVIKFSHVVAPETAKGQAAELFKKLAEQLTKGRVKVEIYPSSTLFKDKDEIGALLKGDVQMLAPALSKFSGLGMPEFEVFDVPYIFPDRGALYRVTEGRIGKDLLKRMDSKGIVGLAYWDNGFKDMSANKAMLKPADFKGMKMRIQPSEVLNAQMRALGATGKMMGFDEAYAALKSGALDGTENPPSNMYAQKMNQVQTHMTVSNHGYLGYVVIANKKFWDGLPADIRTSLTAAMAEATEYEKSNAKFDNDRALAAIAKTGKTDVYVLSAEEEAQWRRALAPVQKQIEARVGKDLMEAVSKEASASQ